MGVQGRGGGGAVGRSTLRQPSLPGGYVLYINET